MDDRTLQQLLNNRQLALKLIANVTYGYTSASFSGRTPCSEIADSIVQTGRETLEKAIAFIHSVERWGAEVVYGDTDSLFVYLKGRTKDEAFRSCSCHGIYRYSYPLPSPPFLQDPGLHLCQGGGSQQDSGPLGSGVGPWGDPAA